MRFCAWSCRSRNRASYATTPPCTWVPKCPAFPICCSASLTSCWLLWGSSYRRWCILVVLLRQRTSLVSLLFPVVLIANFLVMFFGLALDFTSSTPDELSHRPVMIVYFFVVSWIGGALGLMLIESPRLQRFAPPAIVALALILMAVPARLGSGVHQLRAMPQNSPVRLPLALVRAAEYIRSHGSTRDVIQHSQFDRIYALAALSERRTFVSHTMTRMPFRGDMIEARTTAVDHLMESRRASLVSATAHAFGFRWFCSNGATGSIGPPSSPTSQCSEWNPLQTLRVLILGLHRTSNREDEPPNGRGRQEQEAEKMCA